MSENTVTPCYDSNLSDVVIYARYSSERQNDQSIDGQLRCCYEYAQHHGFRVVGEYIDRALSGTHADHRPDFQRMIKDARKRQFKYVLVWKLDRFARNRYDSAIYKTELKKYGVRVLSVTEGIGEGSESIILEAVLEAMAEEYSRQLSENVRRGMHETALKGNSTGGTMPLGYCVEDKKLAIVEREADIVRYIFERYASGIGKRQIINELNSSGWRTRFGAPFTINSISHILKNRKYIGIYSYNGEVELEDGCPAIVSRELFEKCERRREQTRRAPAHAKAKGEEYLLQGKLFCGMCGSPMVGESGRGKGGKVYHYYACATRKKVHTCKKKNEKKDFLEWYIVEQVVEYILTEERIDIISERIVAEYEKSFSVATMKKLEQQSRDIDREINRLVDALINVTAKTAAVKINEKIEALSQQKEETDLELAKLKVSSKAQITAPEIKRWLRGFCRGDLFDMDFRRRIIDVFINSIYLYDDKVVIYFNIKDGKQVSYMEMLSDTEEPGFSDLECSGPPYPADIPL